MRADEIRTSLTAAKAALPLEHDGEAGARRLLSRLPEPEPPRRLRLRARRGAVVAAVVALGGVGVASATAISHSGGVDHFFSDVPHMAQQKEAAGRPVPSAAGMPEAPHTLVATLSLSGPGSAHVYVTTGAVDSHGSRCVLVDQVLADGSDGGSEGVCGAGPDATSATLGGLYAAMVGTVPDPAITRVDVDLNGHTAHAMVVAQYFAIAPPDGLSPSSVTGSGQITGFYADGKTAGSWPFTLATPVDPCTMKVPGSICHSTPNAP